MPSPNEHYAIVREHEDEHGGTVYDIVTSDEFHTQEKTITPGLNRRSVKPDPNYDALSQVNVEPIPKVYISTLNLEDGHLTGVLSKILELKGTLKNSTSNLIGIINRNNQLPYYDGEYVIEPSAHHDIILQTNGKAMADDVTVLQIYSAEVSNPAGGYTFYIADH